MPRLKLAVSVVLVVSIVFTANAADPSEQSLERRFSDVVQPFMKTHCFACHGNEKQEGKLKLSDDSSVAAVVKNHRVWDIVVERLEAEEMPPPKAPQPTTNERKSVIEWIKALREHEGRRNAGDPGIVLARRLSNAEFDYTIRDLTGIDIRPTREFPVDPANEAGFDNSGESLTMSPALVKKYLTAARLVADHLVFKPKGFVFAPHPAVTETDRDKFCVQRIVEFYRKHQVEYADYFLAAWRFQNREMFGKGSASLSDFADESKLSSKYLATVWLVLTEPEESGPLAELQAEWRKLLEIKPGEAEAVRPRTIKDQDVVRGLTPAGLPKAPEEVRRGCEQMRDLVIKLRKEFDSKVEKLHVKGQSDGSQPLVLWWNRQIAAQRMQYVGDGKDETLDAARARFCRVFPNAFSVSSRGHYADPNLGVQVRLLTAGFHLMQGYFRDDAPLCELVLDEAGKQELDTLWQELNFVTLVPQRQYKDFLFFERAEPPRFAGGAEFDFARPEDKDVTSEAKLKRVRDAYLVKARKHEASEQAIEAIETYFANMDADVRWIERTRRDAEPSHLAALTKFAERAYRRPLLPAERDELLAFYRGLREQDGLNHEDAIRDSIVSVLMSPHFCFRFGSVSFMDRRGPEEARTAQPLSDYELASRLSYFLWSSMPDDELLAHAAAGDLHQPETLVGQTRRMLRDDRIRGLATEFAGNWLEFRRFEEHNSVDRERFVSFTNELRQAMYEEPIRFFMDLAKSDRSVLDLLDAGHTFVNPVLAKHYGIDVGQASLPDRRPGKADLQEEWLRIDDARRYGRGGLLPMAVFLTKNSPGLRTSPVKRGYWVVRRLLGEHIPAPPPEVPELPKDETQLGDLTLPQHLARHRDNKACAGCHQRFDSIGLVFEGYGPIGERRDKDLGGRPVDARAIFPDHSEGTGLDGLRRYLTEKRREEFVDNVCRKLLAYGLGRSLLLSDKATIEQMRAKLRADDHRFGSLVESIVTSPQFLKKRGPDDPRE